jgi:hypothetical protein
MCDCPAGETLALRGTIMPDPAGAVQLAAW